MVKERERENVCQTQRNREQNRDRIYVRGREGKTEQKEDWEERGKEKEKSEKNKERKWHIKIEYLPTTCCPSSQLPARVTSTGIVVHIQYYSEAITDATSQLCKLLYMQCNRFELYNGCFMTTRECTPLYQAKMVAKTCKFCHPPRRLIFMLLQM